MIVTDGKELFADLMTGTGDVPSHVAVGTDSTAETVNDTALGAEVAGRKAVSTTQPDAVTNKFVATFGAGDGNGALREVGLFNAAAVGTMVLRTTFPLITKTAAYSLRVQIQVEVL